MKKNHLMAVIFLCTLAGGFFFGRHATSMGIWEAGTASLVMSFIAMFVGMVLTHMHLGDAIRREWKHQDDVRFAREKEFEEHIKTLVGRQRKLRDKCVADVSKAVAQNVANHILSTHFDKLADESKKVALLSDVDEIIDREVELLRKGLPDSDIG